MVKGHSQFLAKKLALILLEPQINPCDMLYHTNVNQLQLKLKNGMENVVADFFFPLVYRHA